MKWILISIVIFLWSCHFKLLGKYIDEKDASIDDYIADFMDDYIADLMDDSIDDSTELYDVLEKDFDEVWDGDDVIELELDDLYLDDQEIVDDSLHSQCGNGTKEVGEECDSGTDSGNGSVFCSNYCRLKCPTNWSPPIRYFSNEYYCVQITQSSGSWESLKESCINDTQSILNLDSDYLIRSNQIEVFINLMVFHSPQLVSGVNLNVLSQDCNGKCKYWIGLYQEIAHPLGDLFLEPDKNWKWVDDTFLDPGRDGIYWGNGEPNDGKRIIEHEDYGELIYQNGLSYLNDAKGDKTNKGICMIKVTVR